ncbi:MAG: lytic transglycosylase domain-containing protein [Candidatus Protistobacter heckmanni]|nr:lytic transglycosylase domain-containing protein [Candidatus Protistobacter heckmanni]
MKAWLSFVLLQDVRANAVSAFGWLGHDPAAPVQLTRTGGGLAVWSWRLLSLLGASSLVLGLALAFNPVWRMQLAYQLLPESAQYAFSSIAEAVEGLPEMVGVRMRAPEGETASSLFAAQSAVVPAALKSKQESAVVAYVARKYRVASAPTGQLVRAAFQVGQEYGVDPLLIVAVMAIESGFNPYAESVMGAQGLMQIMTRVHEEKYANLGGVKAAFTPEANIRVGVQILKDYVQRAGSVEGGLKMYVGSTAENDSSYSTRVLAERERLRQTVGGAPLPGASQQQAAAESSGVADSGHAMTPVSARQAS